MRYVSRAEFTDQFERKTLRFSIKPQKQDSNDSKVYRTKVTLAKTPNVGMVLM